jgi:hypothetical protein
MIRSFNWSQACFRVMDSVAQVKETINKESKIQEE